MARSGTALTRTLVAGIDVGGTKLHTVIATAKGKIVARGRKKTKAENGFAAVIARIGKCLKEACNAAGVKPRQLSAVGVGAPSAIDAKGRAVNAPNMGWRNVPLVDALVEEIGRPVVAGNDCDLGTLGEYTFGAGKGATSLVGFFMGTGLGGGMVRNGEMLRGENNLAAELGHMTVRVDGRRCGCGKRGCLEAYASKTGLGTFFKQAIEKEGRRSSLTKVEGIDLANVRSGILAEAYRAGDKVVREGLDEAVRYLGIGVANMITAFGPDRVVLGGGVFEALGKQLIGAVKRSAKGETFPPPSFRDTGIVLSSLGDDAVALGALAFALSTDGK